MEHLVVLSASARNTRTANDGTGSASLTSLDGSLIPLTISLEEARRVLHRISNSLVLLEVDNDPHWMLVLIGGDPRQANPARLELHEVEPHEEVIAYSRVGLAPTSSAQSGNIIWDIVDPWVKVSGPAERVALPLHLDPLAAEPYRELLARDVKLIFGTRLASDPEQVLFRNGEKHSAKPDEMKVSVAIEGSSSRLQRENAYFKAAAKLIRNRMKLCKPCSCADPSARVCLSPQVEDGKLEIMEVSSCCMASLAEAHSVLQGLGARQLGRVVAI